MLYNHFTEAAFYIYFLICNKTKNKQLPISKLLALNFSFYPKFPSELSYTVISIKSERSVDFALGFGRWV